MGICKSTNSKRHNIRSQNINNNKNINNTNNIKVKKKRVVQQNYNDGFDYLRVQFRNIIQNYPFINFGEHQQEEIENEYVSSNYSPYRFIESKNFQNLFKKLYEVCFLKCEPILANITDDKKKANLIFFRIVIFMFSNLVDIERKKDLIKIILVESYDQDQKKHNIEYLKQEILSLSEVCSEILIYLGMLPQFIEEKELMKVLTEQDYKLNNKFPKVDLDNYYFDYMKTKVKNDNEKIKQKWFDFIIEPLLNEEGKESINNNNNTNTFGNIGLNTIMKKQTFNFFDIDDNTKEEIIYRIFHMLDSNNFLEVLFGKEIPDYDISFYKTDLN